MVRRTGHIWCATHPVDSANRGGHHAGDNSCLPPEPVSGVRLRPHRAVPLHARPEVIATYFKSRDGYGDVVLPQMTARNNALHKLVGFTT